MGPDERQERLLRHVRLGWRRVRASAEERDSARRWLAEHPSPWRQVDELWEEALAGGGPLALWLDAGSRLETWSLEIPLHSILASHPFACLSAWSSPAKSTRS